MGKRLEYRIKHKGLPNRRMFMDRLQSAFARARRDTRRSYALLVVNVSARQFADARLVNDSQDAFQQTGIDPTRLQLEMTERIAAADPRLTITVLSHLKHLGIGTVLDDFGIGFAGRAHALPA